MDLLICNKCGSSSFIEKDSERVCMYCRTKYQLPKTQINAQSVIDINNDVQNLLLKCETDPCNAKRYANLILDIDPSNSEARKILGY